MFAAAKIRSWSAFVIPMTFTGSQALSVETPTTVSTGCPCSRMARTMFTAPTQFVSSACSGKYSQVGTCLRAAALTTTSASRTAELTSAKSRTSPMRNSRARRKFS